MLTKAGKLLISYGNKVSMFPSDSLLKTEFSFKTPDGIDRFFANRIYTGFGNSSAHKLIFTDVTQNVSGGQSDGVALGSGDTPVTEDDYTLDNQILNLTGNYSSADPSVEYVDGVLISYIQYTINNPTENDVIIREVGKFVTAYADTTAGVSGNTYRVLVDRRVLETPITVPAGQSAILRYQFAYSVTSE